MKAIPVPEIEGVYLFEPTPHADERGFFSLAFQPEPDDVAGLKRLRARRSHLFRKAFGILFDEPACSLNDALAGPKILVERNLLRVRVPILEG